MKKFFVFSWIVVFVLCNSLEAQIKSTEPKQAAARASVAEQDNQQTISYRYVDNNQVVVDLRDNTYDRLLMMDMRGTVILKQAISMGFSRIDVSNLGEGVYLMVLRSSLTLKEKSSKFVVRK